MSKAAKRSIFILIFLLIAAVGYAYFSVMEKQALEKEKVQVEQKFAQAQTQFQQKEQMYGQNAKKLEAAYNQVNNEKNQLTQSIEQIERRAEERVKDLTGQLDEISGERDKWKRRIGTVREERDMLLAKISDLTKQLEARPEPAPESEPSKKNEMVKDKPDTSFEFMPPPVDVSRAPSISPESGKAVDEEYWANLLKEKASLQIEIEKLNDELSAKSIEVVEMKQSTESLQLELGALKHEIESIQVDLQHKTDMIDNISLELARTKNDKKFVSDRVEKLNQENGGLRRQLKQLVSVKNALEKSIVRLTQEKDKIEGQLGDTETVIQSKIDEIWEIKDDLDRSIRSNQNKVPTSEVELPPIVVNSSGQSAMGYPMGWGATGLNGRVISINESNNFVIVDIGEKDGIKLGASLSVYRDSKYIARLEVIQLRQDIAAADLKDQWSKVRIGDIIR